MTMIFLNGHPELWGIIPTFLDEADPRPAKQQFNQRYVSGWQPFGGFTLDKKTMDLRYPGDPPTRMLGALFFRDEVIVLYEHEWVMIISEDGTWEVSRMD
jgi:hypothetical protein